MGRPRSRSRDRANAAATKSAAPGQSRRPARSCGAQSPATTRRSRFERQPERSSEATMASRHKVRRPRRRRSIHTEVSNSNLTWPVSNRYPPPYGTGARGPRLGGMNTLLCSKRGVSLSSGELASTCPRGPLARWIAATFVTSFWREVPGGPRGSQKSLWVSGEECSAEAGERLPACALSRGGLL
jgi:hypothetical protein